MVSFLFTTGSWEKGTFFGKARKFFGPSYFVITLGVQSGEHHGCLLGGTYARWTGPLGRLSRPKKRLVISLALCRFCHYIFTGFKMSNPLRYDSEIFNEKLSTSEESRLQK